MKEDISQRKQLESDLLEAKKKAEESERIKSAFLENVSHEIRTPLNAILGYSQLLAIDLEEHAEAGAYLQVVDDNVSIMLHLVNDIIRVSELEAKQVLADYNHWNARTIMQEVLADCKPLFSVEQSRSIQLQLECDPTLENPVIYTDKTKLLIIFKELVENSLKFTPQGFIKIGYDYWENKVRFFVIDSGRGISANDRPKVFTHSFLSRSRLLRVAPQGNRTGFEYGEKNRGPDGG